MARKCLFFVQCETLKASRTSTRIELRRTIPVWQSNVVLPRNRSIVEHRGKRAPITTTCGGHCAHRCFETWFLASTHISSG